MHYLLCLTNEEAGFHQGIADGYHLVGPFERDVDAQHSRSRMIASSSASLAGRVHLLNLRAGEAFRSPCLLRLDGREGPARPGTYLARTGILPGPLLFYGRLDTQADVEEAYAAARIAGAEPRDCLIWMGDEMLHQPPIILRPDGALLTREAA